MWEYTLHLPKSLSPRAILEEVKTTSPLSLPLRLPQGGPQGRAWALETSLGNSAFTHLLETK